MPVFNITESNAKFTISPLGNTATKLAYWDEEAFVTELIVSTITPTPAAPIIENQARSASDRAAATVEKEGLLKPGKETDAKARKRKAEAIDANKPKKVSALLKLVKIVVLFMASRLHQLICGFGAIVMQSFMVLRRVCLWRKIPTCRGQPRTTG